MPGKNHPKHLNKSLLSDTPPNSPKAPILKINNSNHKTKNNNNNNLFPHTTKSEEITMPELTASSAITPTFPPVFFPLTPSTNRGGWRGSMGGATESTRCSINYDEDIFDISSTGKLVRQDQNANENNADKGDTFFSQMRFSFQDRTDFQKSSRSKRRGVVISLGIDQLRSTVITPEHLSCGWDIRSYGLFRRQATATSGSGGANCGRSRTLK